MSPYLLYVAVGSLIENVQQFIGLNPPLPLMKEVFSLKKLSDQIILNFIFDI